LNIFKDERKFKLNIGKRQFQSIKNNQNNKINISNPGPKLSKAKIEKGVDEQSKQGMKTPSK